MIKDLDQMAIDARLNELRDETERFPQNMPRSDKDKGLLHNFLKAFGLCLLIMGQQHENQR